MFLRHAEPLRSRRTVLTRLAASSCCLGDAAAKRDEVNRLGPVQEHPLGALRANMDRVRVVLPLPQNGRWGDTTAEVSLVLRSVTFVTLSDLAY